jgi:hypothetical protein
MPALRSALGSAAVFRRNSARFARFAGPLEAARGGGGLVLTPGSPRRLKTVLLGLVSKLPGRPTTITAVPDHCSITRRPLRLECADAVGFSMRGCHGSHEVLVRIVWSEPRLSSEVSCSELMEDDYGTRCCGICGWSPEPHVELLALSVALSLDSVRGEPRGWLPTGPSDTQRPPA